MPVDVQIALQGGGAKLVALVAAMEGIEELVRQKIIRVTRISGTSAGSIVAVLFAAGVPMAEVRTYLEGMDHKKVFKPRMFPSMWYIVRGNPAYDVMEEFEGAMEALLEKGKRAKQSVSPAAPVTFSQLEIPTFVVVSDLQQRSPVTRTNSDLIVGSVIDSCALPFGLKSLKSRGNAWLVDGGLCENLPTEMLDSGRNEFGPLLAFSFPREGDVPDGLIGYAAALLFTAIDSGVDRTKRRLGEDFVHEIGTSIKTLEFEKAMGEGLKALKAELTGIAQSSTKFVNDFVARHNRQQQQSAGRVAELTEDPWKAAGSNEPLAKSVTDCMHNLYRLHRSMERSCKLRYLDTLLVVTAGSLEALNGAAEQSDPSKRSDKVETMTSYRVIEGRLASHAVAMGLNAWSLIKTRPTVKLWENGKYVIPTRAVFNAAAIDPDEPSKRHMLICFEDPVPAPTQFQLTVTDEVDSFVRGLLDETKPVQNREDFLAITQARKSTDPIASVAIVLLVPRLLRYKVEMKSHRQMEPGSEGQRMSAQDLEKVLEGRQVPDGYEPLGWHWKDAGIDGRFVVGLRVQAFKH